MGQRVRARRHALGWSQERLADECGLHWTYVGQVERGCRNVTVLTLFRLASALRVSVARLLDEE